MKSISKIVIAAIISIISATPSFADREINHDDWHFEISTPWGHEEHNHQVVSSDDGYPVRYGKYSERFEVRPGDCGVSKGGYHNDCTTDRERSEMTSDRDIMYYAGDEYWYRWSIFFPKNYDALHPVHMTFGQFMQGHCKHPVFSFNTKKFRETPEFGVYMTHDYVISPNARWFHFLETHYRNKWHDIVVHAKWSHSENGWFRVWHNGVQKMNYNGKTLWCYDGVYFKYGVYKTGISRILEKDNKTTTVYYDGIRISKSSEGIFDPLPE